MPNLRFVDLVPLVLFLSTAFTPISLARLPSVQSGDGSRGAAGEHRRPRFIRTFVIDDRLSVLRRDPHLGGRVMQRLRTGRSVYIYGSRRAGPGEPLFYRVAVTRRTRGWIHELAIARPGRKGEDSRVHDLITTTTDSVERITLGQLFIRHYRSSPLASRVMLLIGQEADRTAVLLTRRASRRLRAIEEEASGVRRRDYYLSDPGLDRYSKLGIRFEFDEVGGRYVYDGEVYSRIIGMFPATEEAEQARKAMEGRTARLKETTR